MIKIAIVDDDEINLILMKNIIENNTEYNVKCYDGNNTNYIVDILSNEPPDLILMDINMPYMDGIEACKTIKKIDDFKYIPIIFVTCHTSKEYKTKAFNAGGIDYITKPIDVTEFLIRINNQLELTKTKQKLIEQSKMSALGRLAIAVGHDFGNILSIIYLNCAMNLKNNNVDELHDTLQMSIDCVNRGKKILNGLRSVSRPKESMEMIQINMILDNLVTMLKKKLKIKKITINMYQDDNIPLIYADDTDISRVFLNLLVNAIDALNPMKENNAISIITLKEDTNIKITISDNGSGIPEPIKDKIFEPFFTTKGVLWDGPDSSPGTGLGLYTSYNVIKKMGGSIQVSSFESTGTIFTINLPILDKPK